MTTSDAQRRRTEAAIRMAAEQLLRGELPPGGKCDIKTLAAVAGVSRATLYRSYCHLKDDFERRLAMLRAGGHEPDPRDGQIQRLKTDNTELRRRLATLDIEAEELRGFKTTAVSRLAAQHVSAYSSVCRGAYEYLCRGASGVGEEGECAVGSDRQSVTRWREARCAELATVFAMNVPPG